MSDDCSHTLLVHTQVLEERNAARRDAKIAEDEEAKKTAMAADKGSELLELASQHERTMGERNAACIDAVAARSELDGLWREHSWPRPGLTSRAGRRQTLICRGRSSRQSSASVRRPATSRRSYVD